ncbi:hypothetical protein FUA23_21830 [Neolewinella aurantiaca]|uniref:Uncharacterized protein n=1 Tax=Neolewinella aurantiaca TaxID=2602767 RepID=A0A5C7F3U3_9BACT|nr:hypothetical protein [Neolewinella aurantiaca]TXF82343.1 hypothetical protein FUA23_21830 [Neolewinella aurantiaca]
MSKKIGSYFTFILATALIASIPSRINDRVSSLISHMYGEKSYYVYEDETIDRAIKNFYLDSLSYKVFYLEPKNISYDLSGSDLGYTVSKIGNALPQNTNGEFRARSRNLSSVYGDLLKDIKSDQYHKENLDKYAKDFLDYNRNNIGSSIFNFLSYTSPSISNTEREYEDKFSVLNDTISSYYASLISPLDSTLSINVKISTFRRIVKFKIEREWLSSSLLARESEHDCRLSSKYFRRGGPLEYIPQEFWVRGSDKIVVEVEKPEEILEIRSWRSDKLLIIPQNNELSNFYINSPIEGPNKQVHAIKLPRELRLVSIIAEKV